ncbi:AI-2E family transporter [Dellaglioa sp. L3N]
MLDRLRNSKLMFWSLELLIVATLIWMCTKISFIFSPVGTFISTLFIPIIVSGFLFYLFNPVVKFLMKVKFKKFKISRTGAVAIVFVFLAIVLVALIGYMIPRLLSQLGQLVTHIPGYAKAVSDSSTDMFDHLNKYAWFKEIDFDSYLNQFESSMGTYFKSIATNLTNSIGSMIGVVTSVTVVALTVPVMLFYMLKDGQKLVPSLKKLVPEKHGDELVELLGRMGDTISAYIGGQAIECLFVGVFTAIGYSIIGMPYALLLGVVAGFANIVPYIGPYIGLFPALIIAVTQSTQIVIFVIIVVLIVQQVDGNFVYPNVIGKSLNIHPLTIIILLLVAGNIAGLLGMILGIPLYAVVKVVVQYVYDIRRLQEK